MVSTSEGFCPRCLSELFTDQLLDILLDYERPIDTFKVLTFPDQTSFYQNHISAALVPILFLRSTEFIPFFLVVSSCSWLAPSAGRLVPLLPPPLIIPKRP